MAAIDGRGVSPGAPWTRTQESCMLAAEGGVKLRGRGRPRGCAVWMHTSIWCRQEEWDRMNYLSAGSKSLSAWIADRTLNAEPERRKGDRDVPGRRHSICVTTDTWKRIKERAAAYGMSSCEFVLACCLGGEDGTE